jgi:hypothetical protein
LPIVHPITTVPSQVLLPRKSTTWPRKGRPWFFSFTPPVRKPPNPSPGRTRPHSAASVSRKTLVDFGLTSQIYPFNLTGGIPPFNAIMMKVNPTASNSANISDTQTGPSRLSPSRLFSSRQKAASGRAPMSRWVTRPRYCSFNSVSIH